MKVVPGANRDPAVTWTRPEGPSSSAGDTHVHVPFGSRTKCLMKSFTRAPFLPA